MSPLKIDMQISELVRCLALIEGAACEFPECSVGIRSRLLAIGNDIASVNVLHISAGDNPKVMAVVHPSPALMLLMIETRGVLGLGDKTIHCGDDAPVAKGE